MNPGVGATRTRAEALAWAWALTWGFLAGAQTLPAPAAVPSEPVPTSALQRGSALAHQHCAACHLFPEPELLDRQTWDTGALRLMAPYLGVARIRWDGRPDAPRLAHSTLFPPAPVVTQTEWQLIREYYLRSAPEVALPQGERAAIQPQLAHFEPVLLRGEARAPLTTLVHIETGRGVWLGDAAGKGLVHFDAQGQRGQRVPVGGAAVNWVPDGARTFLTLIGQVFPSDVPAGKVLEFTGAPGTDEPREVLSGLERPTDVQISDLNGDGRPDLLVCGFGNRLGRLAWYERTRDGRYVEHLILEQPGAIRAEVRDVDADGRPDLLVLMAQGKEGLYLFANQGRGEFVPRPLLQFHPVFGATYFELADFNGDGAPDVLLTNGDNGEYLSPFKRYHGVRLFLNDGKYRFTEAWFYPLNGAFKAMARDFDGDGDLDVAAISFFPDYTRSPQESFVYFEQRNGLKFAPQSFPGATLGRWLTLDAGDVDGDGDADLVLGAFASGPPGIAIPAPLQKAWQTNGVAGVLLRNTRGPGRKGT